MAQINLDKVETARNAPSGKLGIFVTPDNEAFLIDENGAIYAFGGGATNFIALTDTPANYTDQALKVLRVNTGETGLEFVEIGTITFQVAGTPTEGQVVKFVSGTPTWSNETGGGGFDDVGQGLSIDMDGNPQLGDNVTVFKTDKILYFITEQSDDDYGFFGTIKDVNRIDSTLDVYEDGVAQGIVSSFRSFSENFFRVFIEYIKQVDSESKKMSVEIFDDFTEPVTKMIVTDEINEKGLENSGDYEANFTARSLVTKQYVDTDYHPSTGDILFTKHEGKPRKYGFTTPVTGNIVFDVTGGLETVMVKILHNDDTAPTFSVKDDVCPLEFKGGTYVEDEDNKINAIIDKDDSGTVIAVRYYFDNNAS